MPNMTLKKTPIKNLPPEVRNKIFSEVCLGYSEEEALNEAARCLSCKNKPCVSGCPVAIDIPAFIAKILQKDYDAAYEIINSSSSLPAVCGRVCPQETQCESKCVRKVKGEPVAIGRLERFVADFHLKNTQTKPEKTPLNGHKCAVIGSGPAGLTCAGDLARLGYQVTVFEALHVLGGVLVYGIPEFRLPKQVVKSEIENLQKLGVVFEKNYVVGKLSSIDELFEEGYEAVFLGSGAGLPKFMNIKGENLKGVYSANEFLTRVNLMKAYLPNSDTPIKKSGVVAVVGGGNVAMDAARCAKRIGAEKVYIVYRRSRNEMPARIEEAEHAEEEGITFLTLTNPVEIIGNENDDVVGMACVKMELGDEDASGRRKPIEIPNSEYILDCDTVIMSLGTTPNPLITNVTKGLETDKRGCIIVNEACQTSKKGVFAGGDAVSGSATVILAMGAGKTAAKSIDEYLKSK